MPRTIILSYGLQGRLRDALDRARRFGTDIHLVPATPMATRGLRRHRSSLVTVHEAVGRAGLDAALATDEMVLLLHEDVLLAPDGAQRLLVRADETGTIVAPRTNHLDVDGAAGTLPPDVVQPVGAAEEPRLVHRVRNVCLAGTSEQFGRLLRQRLTAATTRLYSHDGVHLVPEVIATHLDEGQDQREAPEGPDGRPLLVAAMIVRDEQDFLADCLASLEGLVDRVEICDTGSTDRTVEIAEAAGANVMHVEWRDDFAWARNQVLERCRDAWWVLHVDADERIRTADPQRFRQFLATAVHDAEGFDVPLNNIGTDGSELGGQQLPRLFPARGTQFAGRVHEVPQRDDGSMLAWTVTTQLGIEHLGYRPDVVRDRDKRRRNLDLARTDHEAVGDTRSKLQLARALGAFGTHNEELLEVTGDLLEHIRANDDGLNEAGRVPVYQLHSKALFAIGEAEDAWRTICEGLDAYPHSSLLRAIYGEIGNRTGHATTVAERLGRAATEDGARPWSDRMAATTETVQLAVSQLASDDLDAAGATITALLEAGIPEGFDRWGDVVAVTALTKPDEAIDLLLPAATDDATAAALAAVSAVLDPQDAASFAVATCERSGTPSDAQRDLALTLVARADAVEQLESLLGVCPVGPAQLEHVVAQGGDGITAWFLERDGTRDGLDLDAVVAALQSGAAIDDDALVAHLAGDPTGAAIRTVARQAPAERVAPVLARAVAAGASSRTALTTALATITVADDGHAAEVVTPHLHQVETEVLDTLLTRAAGRGSMSVVAVLSRALLDRTVQGTS